MKDGCKTGFTKGATRTQCMRQRSKTEAILAVVQKGERISQQPKRSSCLHILSVRGSVFCRFFLLRLCMQTSHHLVIPKIASRPSRQTEMLKLYSSKRSPTKTTRQQTQINWHHPQKHPIASYQLKSPEVCFCFFSVSTPSQNRHQVTAVCFSFRY